MFRVTAIVLSVLALCARVPAGVQAFNATGESYTPLFVPEKNYAPQFTHLKVQRFNGSVLSHVTVIVTVTPSGYTEIENTSNQPWHDGYWWVGFRMRARHTNGQVFATIPQKYTYNTTTTQKEEGGNWQYNSFHVGSVLPFDQVADGAGPSGRAWKIRMPTTYVIEVSDNLDAWKQGDALGQHAFDLVFSPTAGTINFTPSSHWQAEAEAWAWVTANVTYIFPDTH